MKVSLDDGNAGTWKFDIPCSILDIEKDVELTGKFHKFVSCFYQIVHDHNKLTNYGGCNMCLVDVFCKYDDFCKDFESRWNRFLLNSGTKTRNRPGKLSLSERMAIFTLFHQSNYRTFKHFYKELVEKLHSSVKCNPFKIC